MFSQSSMSERTGDAGPTLVVALGSALAMLPHNGAVVTLLAICGATQRGSYREVMMVGLVGPLLGLSCVIVLGKLFGAF